VLQATPPAVYEQWLDPEALADRMCPRPARCLKVQLEPWLGGRLHFEIEDTGTTFAVSGVFTQLDPPHRLSFTWRCTNWSNSTLDSVVAASFAPYSTSETLMTIEHTLLPPELIEQQRRGSAAIATSSHSRRRRQRRRRNRNRRGVRLNGPAETANQ
jgi:uncharacterized protein YndB with AHSA1/START domain